MIDRFVCRQGDTARSYVARLEDAVERAIPLTDCTVTFSMKAKEGGKTKVQNADCETVDAADGIVAWKPVAGDVDEPGVFLAWFTITNAENETFSVPAALQPNDFNQVIVLSSFTEAP